jgi:hypothetical protein
MMACNPTLKNGFKMKGISTSASASLDHPVQGYMSLLVNPSEGFFENLLLTQKRNFCIKIA